HAPALFADPHRLERAARDLHPKRLDGDAAHLGRFLKRDNSLKPLLVFRILSHLIVQSRWISERVSDLLDQRLGYCLASAFAQCLAPGHAPALFADPDILERAASDLRAHRA